MTKESFSPYSPLDYIKTAEDLEAYVQARIEEDGVITRHIIVCDEKCPICHPKAVTVTTTQQPLHHGLDCGWGTEKT